MNECWLPVTEYENIYEVSNRGRVQSIDREIMERSTGKIQNRKGRLLTQSNSRNKGKAVFVRLSRDGESKLYLVGKLVLDAFEGPCPKGLECCHFDDNPNNNTWPENLRWDTRTNNLHDRVRNGKHHLAIRDSCKNGHKYIPENTYHRISKSGGIRSGRGCRACDREKTARSRKAKQDNSFK